MRGPSLQKTTALSFALHLSAFILTFLVFKQSNSIIIPSPYTVSLVSPDVLTGIDKVKNIDTYAPSKESVALTDIPEKKIKELSKEKKIKELSKIKEMVEEKLSVIAAKKKVEKLVRLRSLISLKASGNKGTGNSQTTSAYSKKGTTYDDYYSKITREIWQQWVFPDTGQKDLETIVSIRILKDGTTIVQKIEKSSGNTLFDRSAIKALAKANPLPPPPSEMEIGVRFYP
jgi:colicin import membrane protein